MEQRLTFLVADDYAFVRRIVYEALKGMKNTDIVEVDNGERALHILGADPEVSGYSEPVDGVAVDEKIDTLACMIIDYNMPFHTGLDVLKLIRTGRTSVPRDFPVIMLTGFHDIPVMAAALKLDVNGFVTKPISKLDLVKKIHESLQAKLKLKPADHYADVELPDLSIDTERRQPKKEPPPPSELGELRELGDLQPGDVLADDVTSVNGQVLVKNGEVITQWLKARLLEIGDRAGLAPIYVVVSPEEDQDTMRSTG